MKPSLIKILILILSTSCSVHVEKKVDGTLTETKLADKDLDTPCPDTVFNSLDYYHQLQLVKKHAVTGMEIYEMNNDDTTLVESWKIMYEANVEGLANKIDEIVAVSDDINNERKLGYENWLEDLDAVVIWTSRTDPNLRIMQKVDGESMSFYTRSTSNKQLDDLWQGSAEINDG